MAQDSRNDKGPEGFNAYDEAKSKGLSRFPDYILCCQLNLHKSPECAAALAKYIDRQWDYLRVNHNGVISSKQLEINRNPDAFGGRKDGKPLTVSEWEKLQKGKNELRLSKLAELERNPQSKPGARGTGRGRPRGRGNNRGRGRTPRGRGSNSTSRGRGRGSGRGANSTTPRGTRSISRGRATGRRVSERDTGGPQPDPLQTSQPSHNYNLRKTRSPSTKSPSGNSTPPKKQTIRAPRLARRNLRDKGQLPRRRGPDKPPKPTNTPPQVAQPPPANPGASLLIEDEVVSNELYNSLLQVDGNISDFTDTESDVDDITPNVQKLPVTPNGFQPNFQSTQIDSTLVSGSASDSEDQQVELVGLDSMLREIRNEIPPISPLPPTLGDAHDTTTEENSCPTTPQPENNFPSQNSILDSARARTEEQFGVSPSAFLVAVQEPCTFLQRVVNISGATVIMDSKADVIRAAFICSVHLDIWPDTEFCSGDMVTCLLKTKRYGEIYVVSLYCDAEEQPIPEKLRALLNKARRENKEVLVMGDLNAHSYACWNSKKTDTRGRAWEKLISDKGLRVLNRGDKFTFIASTGQTIVDVCMATPGLAKLARHFATIDHVPSSDHVLNEFMLLTEDCWSPRPPGYNLKECKTQWLKVQAAMEEKPSRVLGSIWTPADLDIEGPGIEEDLHSIMDKYSQPSDTITRIYPIEWWSKKIDKLQARLKTIRQYLRKWAYKRLNRNLPDTPNNKMKYTFADLKEIRRAFKKACRRAKKVHWRKWVCDIDKTVVTADLNKRLNKEHNAEIGLFTKPNGDRCNIEETMDLLKDTHFPGNTKVKPQQTVPLAPSVDINDPKADFITPEKVKACIDSFKPLKGAGPDRLKAKIYQRLGPQFLQRLTNLYKASYLLGIQPSNFKQVRVIFIPKPGRPDYSVAKAHRPISLMNVVMKIMEKFLLWHHEDTILMEKPLESEQHGFMKAKSCDSAITNVLSRAELALKKDEYCVLTLLDVEGAFDNATYKSMLDPIRDKGTPINFISWIQDFLQCRKSVIQVKGVEREIYHTRGTPQGGCSSPYLWACVINELIQLIKPMDKLFIVCYADDIALTSSGPDLLDCVDRLQRGIDAVEQWAAARSLKLSHSKSEVLLLTKKRKYYSIVESTPKLCVGDVPVSYALGPVRYLGLWLDRKLSWNDHVRIKIAKVKRLLMKMISQTGSWWGLQPYQGRYFWEALGRTVLSYGCMAWQHCTRKVSIRDRLRSVQRLGFKLIAPFRKGTPNLGLELIFNCPPMEVHLARMAIKAYFRTLQHAPFTREQLATTVVSKISHRNWIWNMIDDHGLAYLESPLDVVPLHRKWDNRYEVDLDSMSPHNPARGIPDPRGVNVYTDGSKNRHQSGAGVVVLNGGQVHKNPATKEELNFQYHLGEKTTVFQSELFAQKMASHLIINGALGSPDWLKTQDVTIYTDNQGTLWALRGIWVNSLLLQQTRDLLDLAADQCKSLTIKWVRGHSRHLGNDLADTAARAGRDDNVTPDWETPLLAKAVMHKEIDNLAKAKWIRIWEEALTCRQTRHWFPLGPRPKFSDELMKLPKILLGQMIQIITGHTYLQRHQAIIDESERQRIIAANNYDNADDDGYAIIDAPDPSCTRCKMGEETPLHLLTDCNSLATLRQSIFGTPDLIERGAIPDFSHLPLHKVVSFFRDAKFKTLTMQPFFDEYIPTKNSKGEEDKELAQMKDSGTKEGNEFLMKLIYRK